MIENLRTSRNFKFQKKPQVSKQKRAYSLEKCCLRHNLSLHSLTSICASFRLLHIHILM